MFDFFTVLIICLIGLGPLILSIIMIVKYFQIASDVRIIKRYVHPTGDFSALQDAVLGDKQVTKKLVLIDFHQSVGALVDDNVLSVRGFEREYKLFLKDAEAAGVEFSEEELARISDYTLFKRLYKYC